MTVDIDREELEGHEAMGFAIDSMLYRLRTNVPAFVTAVNLAKNTVDVQPAVMRKVNGVIAPAPPVMDVPIAFYGSGGFVVTFQPAVGDMCELWVNDRSIERLKLAGGVNDPGKIRRHDISDSVAYFGFNDYGNAYPDIKSGMEVRSRDGNTSFHVENDKITLTIAGVEVATYEAAMINFKVPVIYSVAGVPVSNISGAGTAFTGGTLTHNGKNIGDTHAHSGVQSGPSNTGAPI